MNRSRLNKIEKALRPNIKNYSLFAIECPAQPEKSRYTIWDGIPGSGGKQITKEEFDQLSQRIQALKIVRGNPIVKIIDDIPVNERKG